MDKLDERAAYAYHTLVGAGEGELADELHAYLTKGIELLERLHDAAERYKSAENEAFSGEETPAKRAAGRAAAAGWQAANTLSDAIKTNGQGRRRKGGGYY